MSYGVDVSYDWQMCPEKLGCLAVKYFVNDKQLYEVRTCTHYHGSPFTADKSLVYSPVQCFILYNYEILSLNFVFEL